MLFVLDARYDEVTDTMYYIVGKPNGTVLAMTKFEVPEVRHSFIRDAPIARHWDGKEPYTFMVPASDEPECGKTYTTAFDEVQVSEPKLTFTFEKFERREFVVIFPRGTHVRIIVGFCKENGYWIVPRKDEDDERRQDGNGEETGRGEADGNAILPFRGK